MLDLVQPAVERAEAGDTVLVTDSSGTLGDVYTFLPPHLWYASQVEFGKDTRVDLCTIDGVVKDQPVAERFPIGTTQPCSDLDTGVPKELVTSGVIDGKDVDVFLVKHP